MRSCTVATISMRPRCAHGKKGQDFNVAGVRSCTGDGFSIVLYSHVHMVREVNGAPVVWFIGPMISLRPQCTGA